VAIFSDDDVDNSNNIIAGIITQFLQFNTIIIIIIIIIINSHIHHSL
jgi:hypothetical protein